MGAIKSDLEVQLHHSNQGYWHKPSSVNKQQFMRAQNVVASEKSFEVFTFITYLRIKKVTAAVT